MLYSPRFGLRVPVHAADAAGRRRISSGHPANRERKVATSTRDPRGNDPDSPRVSLSRADFREIDQICNGHLLAQFREGINY